MDYKITLEAHGDSFSVETNDVTSDDIVTKILGLMIAAGWHPDSVAQSARHYAHERIGEKCCCGKWERSESEIEQNTCFDCGYNINE